MERVLPELSPWIGERRVETSSPPTPATATQVARAAIARHGSTALPEKRAITRGFGRSAPVNPNRRRRVRGSIGFVARVYLCCRYQRFGSVLKGGDVDPVRLPRRSPNLNAYAGRFVRSTKFECLAQIIPSEERYIRHAMKVYTEKCHLERNHQGLDNQLIEKRKGVVDMNSPVVRHERLGGVLNYYERKPV